MSEEDIIAVEFPEHSLEDAGAERLFGALLEEIATREKSLAGLNTLYQRMKSLPHAFDPEDLGMVRRHYQRLSSELVTLKAKLEEKRHVYDNTVVNMRKALETRQTVFDEADELMDSNPELLDQLVAKQKRLVGSVAAMEQKLTAGAV